MGAGRSGNFGNTKGSQDGATALDYISNGLALASLIPGVDTVTDILSIPVDIARKDWLSVGFDLVGIIPWVGEPSDAAKLARITDKVSDASRIVNKADDISDATKAVSKTTKNISKVSPGNLTPTHSLTLSNKKYKSLFDDISQHGMKESIKYIEHNGEKYVVDGHHRLRVAKQLKMKDVPVEKVSLPYKGYQTLEDLFWFDDIK